MGIESSYYNKEDTDSLISDAYDEAHSEIIATQSNLELTNEALTLSITQLSTSTDSQFEAMASYIRYENGIVIVGRTDSELDFRISNSEIAACYDGTAVSYWNASKQYTPRQLHIPSGGSFRLGNIMWQPRTSGNLSLFWVNS